MNRFLVARSSELGSFVRSGRMVGGRWEEGEENVWDYILRFLTTVGSLAS
jgi:hypothetical protein